MTTSTPKITCRHVWKIFGPHPEGIQSYLDAGLSRNEILDQTGHVVAVRDVSLAVQEGEVFVVMGLSGSGKSTLIRCLTRLIEPTRGEILLDGRDVMQMDKDELRQVRRYQMSMVFQRFGLFPHRTVLENAAYGLEVRGLKKGERYAQAREVLSLVGLSEWETYYPKELSGGMQQRVGLARALAVNPEVLLCDEPFSALDPLIRREMQAELLDLQQRLHKTILFITHDFLEALKLGDRIAIMKDGEIVQVGTPADIVAHPADAYVAAFTKDVPRVKVLTAVSVMTPLNGQEPSQIAGAPRVPADTSLEALIPLTAEHDRPLLVIDETDSPLGYLDRTAVLRALSSET